MNDGETVRADYDLGDFVPAAVQGRLVRSGALPDDLCVELLRIGARERPESMAVVTVAADGTFVAEDLLPGTYRIGVRADGAAPTKSPFQLFVPGLVAETFVLAAGQRLPLVVPLPPRRLVVHLQHADGSPVRHEAIVARCGDAQWPSFAMSPPVFDEQIVLDPAPVLPVEFRLASGTWSPPVVMPPDGAKAEVTVVLPDPPK